MKVRVTTESIADLSDELYREYNIGVLPLIVSLGGEEFYDGKNIVPDDIYKFVEKTKILPKTAARSPEEYEEFFTDIFDEGYDAIVHISISDKSSASYKHACAVAEKMKNVYAFDSMSLSTGTGIQVLYAAELAQEGKSPEEIIELLTAKRAKASCSFITDNIIYLHKGGRCTNTQLFLATVLRIKPTIEMIDGQLVAGKKYFGSLKRVITEYVRCILDNAAPELKRIFITYTEIDKEIVDKVEEIIKEKFNFEKITHTMAGATITCHCGRGTLGVLFYNK